MELVDLGPALVDADGAPSSGFGVFDTALAAGGRVKAIVAPGMAGVTRREIDELTERAERFGAKGLAHLALEPRRRGQGPDREVPVRRHRSARSSRQPARSRGRPDPDRRRRADVTADVLGRLRVELGDRLGLADPNVLAYVWINRFPMYQWDAENGRWHATHNPFSGVLPEDEAAARDRVGRPRPSRRRTIRPAAPGRSSTTSRSTAGSSVAGRSGSTAASSSSAQLPAPGSLARGGCARSSGPSSTPSTTARRRTAGSRSGIDRWAALLARQTNIREVMAFPKTQSGTDLMLEAPSLPEPGPATRARACASSAYPGRRPHRRALTRRRERRAARRRCRSAVPRLAALARRDLHSRSRGSSTLVARSVALDRGRSTAAVSRSAAAGARGLARANGDVRRDAAAARSGWPRIAGVFFAGDLLMFWHHADRGRSGPGWPRSWATCRSSSSAVFAWLLLGRRRPRRRRSW